MTDKYLYDTDDVPKIPDDVIDARLNLLRMHLKKLLEPHFMEQDVYKIADVHRAVAFWEKRKDKETI